MRTLILSVALALSASAATLNIGTASVNQQNPLLFTLDLNVNVPTSLAISVAGCEAFGGAPVNPYQVTNGCFAENFWTPANVSINPNNPNQATVTIPIDPSFGNTVSYSAITLILRGNWLGEGFSQFACDGIRSAPCDVRWQIWGSGQTALVQQPMVISNISEVPEPSTYGMVGVAALALGWWRRRR